VLFFIIGSNVLFRPSRETEVGLREAPFAADTAPQIVSHIPSICGEIYSLPNTGFSPRISLQLLETLRDSPFLRRAGRCRNCTICFFGAEVSPEAAGPINLPHRFPHEHWRLSARVLGLTATLAMRWTASSTTAQAMANARQLGQVGSCPEKLVGAKRGEAHSFSQCFRPRGSTIPPLRNQADFRPDRSAPPAPG